MGRPGSLSAFDLQRWVPQGDAARFVEHFWSVSWDLRGQQPFDSTVITFPAMHITHEWGDGTGAGEVGRHGYPLPTTLLHGVVDRVFRTTIGGSGTVVGARFRPGGFVARFGGDAAQLTGRVLPVPAALFGGPVELADDVTEASGQLSRLIGQAGEPDPTFLALCALVDRIRDDTGLHRVEQVMAHSPWSVRTTQRIVRRYVGVPVKWVLCRYRLQNAALAIETDPDHDFADLAVRLGWYDQAHFINDFRDMLGTTPGEYARAYGAGR